MYLEAFYYSCSEELLCVAAYLTEAFQQANPGVAIDDQDDDENWVEIDTGKLFRTTTDADFAFVDNNVGNTVGWEACWNVSQSDLELSNFEVHFNRLPEETTSTGRNTGNAQALLCIAVSCPTP